MASLINQQINATYEGLIKTTDNAAAGVTPKVLTDGAGNALPMEIGTASVLFPTGTVDFTGSTVLGLPSAAGLESGTGTDSMQSAASLTTTAADAAGIRSIALGENAQASVDNSIALGNSTRAYGNAASIAIGDDADGHNGGVGIGDGAKAYYGSVSIGKGANSSFTTFGNVHIGDGAQNTTGGNGANVTIGVNATQTSNAEYSTAIGYGSTVSANNAVALGANVTASTADTVSVKSLETQTNSTPTAGGIIMSDAGGTDRRINIDASGALQIDSTPVGGGGAAGLVSGTGTDSMKSSSSLTTTAATATEADAISLGNGTDARGVNDIVIGKGAETKVDALYGSNIVIGENAAQAGSEWTIVIGKNGGKGGAQSGAAGSAAIFIGKDTYNSAGAGGNQNIVIGNGAHCNGSSEQIVIGLDADGQANAGGIALGRQALSQGLNSTAVGRSSQASFSAFAGGYQAVATGSESVAVGYSADATTNGAVALGDRALSNITNGVAIGSQVTAVYADGTTVKNFAIANYANLNFADDTAAATGGVPLGGVYHTSGALKIRTT